MRRSGGDAERARWTWVAKATMVVGAMGHARKLIHDSALDPDTVRMMGDAFDAAWRMIEPALKAQPQSIIDGARTLLSSAIVERVNVGLMPPSILQDEAIGVVKDSYPQLPISGTYLY
jgi:hypothetical protein